MFFLTCRISITQEQKQNTEGWRDLEIFGVSLWLKPWLVIEQQITD